MALVMLSFGPFQLDERSRALFRNDERVAITDRQGRLLQLLAAHPGVIVSKDALVAAGWGEIAVTDNSVEKAICLLRRVLGHRPDGGGYIETVPRQGYRFVGDSRRVAARGSPATIDAWLAAPRRWQEGRTALEALTCEQLPRAQRAFRHLVALSPDDPPAHIGLANACAFQFESTRIDRMPDHAALREAQQHADEACRLDPDSAEGWATLAFVLHGAGDADRALAAARRAVSLEPANWRHTLRLAVVSWGDVRLRAAGRTLQLLPGLGLAHWLAATVHVARLALDAAMRELDKGVAVQDGHLESQGAFGGVGLHWLRGLLQLHAGDHDAAAESLQRELALERAGHLYSRESCANAWYAIGAMHVRAGARDEALTAFDEALRRVEGHPLALAAGAALGRSTSSSPTDPRAPITPATVTTSVDEMLARAVRDTWHGGSAQAASVVFETLAQTAPGSAGWIIPIEPMLRVTDQPELWNPVLTLLRTRAI